MIYAGASSHPLDEVHAGPCRIVEYQRDEAPDDKENGIDWRNQHLADCVGVVIHDDGRELAEHRWILVAEAAADAVDQHENLPVRVVHPGPFTLVDKESNPLVLGNLLGCVDGRSIQETDHARGRVSL